MGQLDLDEPPGRDRAGVTDHGAAGAHDRVAPRERRARGKGLKPRRGAVERAPAPLEQEPRGDDESLPAPFEARAVALERARGPGAEPLAGTAEAGTELVEVELAHGALGARVEEVSP